MTASATHAPTGRAIPARQSRWSWRAVLEVIAVLVVAALVLLVRAWPLGGASLDYQDEGVYWQSLRAMAHGQPLFSAIFSSQPPLFLPSLYPFYLLLGQTIAAARIGVLAYAALGLLGVYWAGSATGGRWTGVAAFVLLAANPLYVAESHVVQAEMPALGFALLAVAFAASMTRHIGRRRDVLALLSGCAACVGILIKLFDVVALIPIALYAAAPLFDTLSDDDGRVRRPPRRLVQRGLALALRGLALVGVGLVTTGIVALLPFHGRWHLIYDQAVTFHTIAEHTFLNTGWRANVNLIATTWTEYPLLAVALVACGLAVWRRVWATVPPLLWFLASLGLLIHQQPLIWHHAVLLSPPLALLGGLAASAVAGFRIRPSLPGLLTLSRFAVGMTCVLFVAATVAELALKIEDARTAAPLDPAVQRAMVRSLDAATRPGDLIATDNQYVAASADRSVPPQLVDTSQVRIVVAYQTGGDLSPGGIEGVITRDHVRAILVASGRFRLIPGFLTWVRLHYHTAARFGADGVLYLS